MAGPNNTVRMKTMETSITDLSQRIDQVVSTLQTVTNIVNQVSKTAANNVAISVTWETAAKLQELAASYGSTVPVFLQAVVSRINIASPAEDTTEDTTDVEEQLAS